MSKPSGGKRRRLRARPLLVAAGAVTVMSVAGCGGFHGALARCPPGDTSAECAEPDFSAEVPADLGADDLAHGND